MNFYGLAMGIAMIAAVGLGHVVVVKWEYYWGSETWVGLLAIGLLLVIASLFSGNVFLSGCLGILGASLLWGVHELFAQKKRVAKGWFSENPRRKN